MGKKKTDIYELIENLVWEMGSGSEYLSLCFPRGLAISQYVANAPTARSISARYIIENHQWGTRGVDGKLPLRVVKLVDCDSEHLKNILRTQSHISSLTTLVITAILMERKALKTLRASAKSSDSQE